MCACARMHAYMRGVCAYSYAQAIMGVVHVWKSENSLWELALSFYHVDSGD